MLLKLKIDHSTFIRFYMAWLVGASIWRVRFPAPEKGMWLDCKW